MMVHKEYFAFKTLKLITIQPLVKYNNTSERLNKLTLISLSMTKSINKIRKSIYRGQVGIRGLLVPEVVGG